MYAMHFTRQCVLMAEETGDIEDYRETRTKILQCLQKNIKQPHEDGSDLHIQINHLCETTRSIIIDLMIEKES
ncbi:hypothetical protein ACET3Z_027426 [Daucus carota]